MNPTARPYASPLLCLLQAAAAVLLLWVVSVFSAWPPSAGSQRQTEFNASGHAPFFHLLADVGTANFAAEDDNASSPVPPLVGVHPLLLSRTLATQTGQPVRFRRLFLTSPLRLHLLVRVLLI